MTARSRFALAIYRRFQLPLTIAAAALGGPALLWIIVTAAEHRI